MISISGNLLEIHATAGYVHVTKHSSSFHIRLERIGLSWFDDLTLLEAKAVAKALTNKPFASGNIRLGPTTLDVGQRLYLVTIAVLDGPEIDMSISYAEQLAGFLSVPPTLPDAAGAAKRKMDNNLRQAFS